MLGQEMNANNVTTKLSSKEWKLVCFEEEGKKFLPSADQIGDRMRFRFDHRVKFIEISQMNLGMWEYDPQSNDLLIVNTETNEVRNMKVVKLTDSDFVLEYKDSEGLQLKMYMTAVAKW